MTCNSSIFMKKQENEIIHIHTKIGRWFSLIQSREAKKYFCQAQINTFHKNDNYNKIQQQKHD